MKVKRTSIADLIRPLREAKEKERERDKEREKERGKKSVEDAKVSDDVTTTEGTIATSRHLADDAGGTTVPASPLTTMMPPSDVPPSYPTTVTSHDLTIPTLSNLEEEAVFALPGGIANSVVTFPVTEQERMKEQLRGTPYGERRLKVTKRSLREGKSQSLILLTGSEPEDKDAGSKVSLTKLSTHTRTHTVRSCDRKREGHWRK